MRNAQNDLEMIETLKLHQGHPFEHYIDFIQHLYKYANESREALPYWIKRGRSAESWLKHILDNYDMDPVDALMISKFLEGEEITEDDAIQQIHGCDAETFYGGGQG